MENGNSPAVNITASLSISKKHGKSIIPIAVKLAVVLMSCMGSIISFLTCIELPIKEWAVITVLIVSCMIFTLTFNMKKRAGGGIASLTSAALFLLLTGLLRNEICAGLANTLNIYLARIRSQFRSEPFIPIAEPELSERHITVFFCFLAVIICIFAAYFVSKEWYALGLCISPLFPPVAVLMFGLEPDYLAFSAVAAGCASALALEAGSGEKINSTKYRYAASCSGITAALLTIICFFAAAAAVKLSGYQRSERIDNIYNNITGYIERGEMQNVFEEVLTFVSRDSGRTGAIDHGKLGEFDEIYFDGRTVLEVTMPKPENTVYLRGFIGTDYTGKSWKPLSGARLRKLDEIVGSFENTGLSSLLFDSYSLKNAGSEMPKYSFSIENISAGRDNLYMPYLLVPESVSRYALETGGGFAGGSRSYFGQIYDPSGFYGYQGIFRMRWNISQTMSADEAAYRNFVYENYLDLPEEHERLDMIFDENYYQYITEEEIRTGKSTLDEMTVFSRKLYFIKSWLRNNCEYSLSAGKLPSGRDFIDRFLETKKGSCSHFASTAVMMCRYAGIPARYVEGYIIKPNTDYPASVNKGETVTINVTDSRAHAWAEIYIDGFGWYPMEFTSGYGNIRTALPTETAAPETVSETVSSAESEETEIAETSAGESAPSAESSAADGDTNSPPAAQESSAALPENTSVTEVTEPPANTVENIPEPEISKAPVIGFGIFGIKGGRKVDIYYDLTEIFLAVLVIIAVPSVFIIRRRICLLIYKKKCSSGRKKAALAAYKKFRRLAELMKLPEQGEMGDLEYAKALSESSELLSDGTAETVIRTALKASFGGKQLSSDEAHEAVLAVNSFAKRYYSSLSALERLKAKYIHCII